MRTRFGPTLSVPYSIEINDLPAMIFYQEPHRAFEETSIGQFDEMPLSENHPLVMGIMYHS